MKTKLFLLILLFIIPFGCKEDKKIEIIQADQVYFASNELEVLPEIIVKEADGKLIYRITTEVKELYDSLDQNEKESFKVDYRLLVNENGKVDKIQVIKSKYPQFDKIMAEAVVNLKFSPAIKEGKKVKFIFPWGYDHKMLSTLNLNIPQQDSDQNIYFVAVEEMPEPIGGMYTIQSKIKYPESAKNQGIEGKVFIQAFIDEIGNVEEAKVIKGAGYGLDEAALEAVKQTKFTPGKQKGKPVKVQVSIPIIFKLESKITIEEILNKLKWNINQAEVIRVASNYLKVTDYKELKQKNSRLRVIQFTGGSLYGIKTNSWSFAFENDNLDFISIQFKSTSSSDKSKTYSELKSEIEKISLTKIESQPNEWILSFDNKTLARLQIYPGGSTNDIQILLSSNKYINEHSLK